MDKVIKKRIMTSLTSKITHFRCPMCGGGPFTIIDGVVTLPVKENLDAMVMTEDKELVSVVLVCNKCGYTSFHNLLALNISVDI